VTAHCSKYQTTALHIQVTDSYRCDIQPGASNVTDCQPLASVSAFTLILCDPQNVVYFLSYMLSLKYNIHLQYALLICYIYDI